MGAFCKPIASARCRCYTSFTCLWMWIYRCFSSRQVLCWEGVGIFMHKYFWSFKHSQKADTAVKKPSLERMTSWNLKIPDLWLRCASPTSDLHAQSHLNVIFLVTSVSAHLGQKYLVMDTAADTSSLAWSELIQLKNGFRKWSFTSFPGVLLFLRGIKHMGKVFVVRKWVICFVRGVLLPLKMFHWLLPNC